MATVIDSLLVELGLDSGEYEKAIKKSLVELAKLNNAQDKGAKNAKNQNKLVAESYSKIRNELMALAAITLGAKGIKDFFTNMVTGESTLGRLAKNLSMSARELDAWGAAAESVGGSAQGMQQSMQSLQGGMMAFSLGETSPVVNGIRALSEIDKASGGAGISMVDAAGKMRPMKDILLDISGVLQKMKPQEQIKAAQMLGFDSGTMYLLRQGRAEVSKTYDEMYRASGVTDASVRDAQRVQAQMAKLKREFYGIGQSLFGSMGPALEEIVKQFHRLSIWLRDNKKETIEFVRDTANAIKQLVSAIAELVRFLNQVKPLTQSPLSVLNPLEMAYKGAKSVEGLGASVAHFFMGTPTEMAHKGAKSDEGLRANVAHFFMGTPNVPIGASVKPGNVANNTSSVQTTIGTMNINTMATDSNGIAAGMHDALSQHTLIAFGATGVN